MPAREGPLMRVWLRSNRASRTSASPRRRGRLSCPLVSYSAGQRFDGPSPVSALAWLARMGFSPVRKIEPRHVAFELCRKPPPQLDLVGGSARSRTGDRPFVDDVRRP